MKSTIRYGKCGANGLATGHWSHGSDDMGYTVRKRDFSNDNPITFVKREQRGGPEGGPPVTVGIACNTKDRKLLASVQTLVIAAINQISEYRGTPGRAGASGPLGRFQPAQANGYNKARSIRCSGPVDSRDIGLCQPRHRAKVGCPYSGRISRLRRVRARRTCHICPRRPYTRQRQPDCPSWW